MKPVSQTYELWPSAIWYAGVVHDCAKIVTDAHTVGSAIERRVVLHMSRKQAEQLRDQLNEWLELGRVEARDRMAPSQHEKGTEA